MIRHGWYKRKGVSGDAYGYKPFWILRLLCKNAGHTISLLPVFVHTYKRHALSFVVNCLSKHIEQKQPLSAVAREAGLCVRTLKRWKQSFSARQDAKHCCLLPGRRIASTQTFAEALLSHFRTSFGRGCLLDGSIKAMFTLWASLTHALY